MLTTAIAQSTYDRHVVFDNSLPNGGYETSASYLVAPSMLETSDSKFPVEQNHFVSPPNSLRLKWKSAPGGDWRLTVEVSRRYARPFKFEGDSLTFWCYPEFDITEENSPRVFLKDINENGTAALPFVTGKARIPAGKWTLVKLPVLAVNTNSYNSTDDPKFIPGKMMSVSWMQGLDDNEEHILYIDDIQIRDGKADDLTPPPPPKADARRRHGVRPRSGS